MIDSASADRSRFFSVAELAKEFSLTSQGIRFYEESGLITPARVGRTRVFNYQDRARLVLIQRLRGLGFSIEAIREYLSLYKADVTGAAQYRRGLERIAERIRELESKRRDLDETLAGLRELEFEASRIAGGSATRTARPTGLRQPSSAPAEGPFARPTLRRPIIDLAEGCPPIARFYPCLSTAYWKDRFLPTDAPTTSFQPFGGAKTYCWPAFRVDTVGTMCGNPLLQCRRL
jgi:DNA-binding transcriptional MerR regulator